MKLLNKNGEDHGLIKVVANSCVEDPFKNMKPETKKKAEALFKKDHEVVKVQYLNSRGHNERLEMPYCQWSSDPIQYWKFIPEETYEVPRGLVDIVNDPSKTMVQRSDIVDRSGVPMKKDGKGETIHRMVPAGF